jgi:hypothetical protein
MAAGRDRYLVDCSPSVSRPARRCELSARDWHIGEVFFAGNAWPQSMAYPGDDKVSSRAEARCDAAFLKYDGTDNPDSMFTYDYIDPDNTTWPADDRWLVCVAYDATSAQPDGAPVNYSIKGSSR